MGEQGFLDMALRNACWQEDRLLLRGFLDRVEATRLKRKKGNTRKIDEGTPVSLPQWSDWTLERSPEGTVRRQDWDTNACDREMPALR